MRELEYIEEDIEELKKILCLNYNIDLTTPHAIIDENTYVKLEKFILDRKINNKIRIKIIEAISTKNCLNLFTFIYVLDIKIKELKYLLN